MELNLSDINAEFGVGGIAPLDGASHPDLSMPQSLQFVEEQYLPQVQESQVLDTQHNSINPWPPQFIVELALRIDSTEVILDRHNLTEEQYNRFMEIPSFRREVAAMMKELSDNGQTFRVKARTQAEVHLETLDSIVNDLSVAASTRLDGIKQLVKWGDLEPSNNAQEQNTGQTVNIQINF